MFHSKDKGKSARKESADNESKQDDNHLHPNDNQSDLIHIHNLSLHGLDVDGLLNGMCPDPQHIALRQKCGLSPYRVTKIENDSDHENEEKEEERLYPLELLSSMVTDSEIKVSSKSKDKHHINPTAVLSIGFIDLLRNLKYGKPELIIEALRKESFPENIEKAVVRIVDELALNLIIVWSTYFVFDYIPSLRLHLTFSSKENGQKLLDFRKRFDSGSGETSTSGIPGMKRAYWNGAQVYRHDEHIS